jgi:hypothetical protein
MHVIVTHTEYIFKGICIPQIASPCATSSLMFSKMVSSE